MTVLAFRGATRIVDLLICAIWFTLLALLVSFTVLGLSYVGEIVPSTGATVQAQ